MPANFNLYHHFQKQFLECYDQVVLTTSDGVTWTYKDLDKSSARFANFLLELGLQTGDRVSAQVHKSPQAMCLFLGCLRAGLVFHPLNTGYRESELDYFIANAEPAAIVSDQSSAEIFSKLAGNHKVDHLYTLNADGTGSLSTLSAQKGDTSVVVHRDADDLAALLYSSGTTGVPKGIMLSHLNLLSNSKTLVAHWGFTDQDVLLHALPIFHVHGLFVALGCVFLSGASMRWLDKFDAGQVIQNLPLATVMMGVPTYYTRLLDHPDFSYDVAAARRLYISGSAPLLQDTFSAFEALTGHAILERYGMTETNMNTSNPLDGARKAGTVGLPLPGTDVRIVDQDQRTTKVGQVGSIQVRGENVFKGYWKLPEKTAEEFTRDGFFITGDEGSVDVDGYISIVGRAKDIIISGGLNIYPKELELVIDELDGIKESAVIGVPHQDLGEGVIAIVVLHGEMSLDEQVVISAMKAQLARFKVPKRFVVVDELPRNTMGKVQKNKLREDWADLLS